MKRFSQQTPEFSSRLPDVGTTVFTVMSALAAKHQAINLGQGYPDFPCSRELIGLVNASMLADQNQYPPMIGIPELRNEVSKKIRELYGHSYDPDKEITITAGGTQGILTAVLCCVSPGDEVIVIEPAYDSYRPSIELAGGITIGISLETKIGNNGRTVSYSIPWDKLSQAINTKTRLILINTPHNPTGMVWKNADLNHLADLVKDTNILICSDEVYEHMVYDNLEHQSVARHPILAARSFLISSFGKTYHVTGWKVGYVAAPSMLTDEFRKVHQFNVFTVNTPMQYGLAKYLINSKPYLELSAFYQAKRDRFRFGLSNTKFNLLHSEGTYFQCVDYSNLGIPEAKLKEDEFCRWLTTEIGVAAIPVSAFYKEAIDSSIIRFCFAKQDQTLINALHKLQKI